MGETKNLPVNAPRLKPLMNAAWTWSRRVPRRILKFSRANWVGTVIILAVTIIFFWPMITRIGTYSIGGDAMFNSWTLARDQHCILRQNCPSYANGNIFYPNKNSMLYSETQLSAGLITLPLYFINQNPIFSYNVWTIASFFLGGWFMYLLAKYLSRGNEFYSVLAGLAFAFGPIKIAEATHLQNLSIFYLPLVILLILKYLRASHRKYLAALFITLVLMFYASWYQMAFGLIAIGGLLLGAWGLKITKPHQLLPVLAVLVLAVASTWPLAREYVRFSKQSGASYGVSDQNLFSSSVADYFIPYKGTELGNLYYKLSPKAQVNSYSPDGDSYVGLTLYAVGITVFITSFVKRKKSQAWAGIYKLTVVFLLIAAAGLIISLGPFLKLKSSYLHHVPGGGLMQFTVALPYLAVDLLLPQLEFIRAVDRASVLVQFGFCCILALVPLVLAEFHSKKLIKYGVSALLLVLMFLELAPTHSVAMSGNPYYYNMNIPKAYQYIHDNPAVNNIIVLAPDYNYPGQTFLPPPFRNGVFEQVLWAGYDNKNTFNGYSGFFPKQYNADIDKFNNFQAADLPLMRSLGLRYVLVDKLLSSSEPSLVDNIANAGPVKVYQDSRYTLFKL